MSSNKFVKTLHTISKTTNKCGFNKLIGITYDVKNLDFVNKNLKKRKITIQKVSNFRSEEDVRKDLKSFYTSDNNLYILELQFLVESEHLRLLIHLVEKIEAESKNS